MELMLERRLAVDRPATDTELRLSRQEVEHAVERVFEAARDEYFEDGMESAFSRQLLSLVETYCEQMKEELAYWLVREKASPYVASEASRWLGQVDHAPSYRYRRWLLERCLRASSAIVRDGAGLGLAAMDDAHTIPSLRQAVQRESCEELRVNLQQVLDQLEG